jgi:hypothetical protein
MTEKINFLEIVDEILINFESIIKKTNRLIVESEETLKYLDEDFLWKFYRLDMWWGYIDIKRKLKALREKKQHYIHAMRKTKHNRALVIEERKII